MNSSPRKKVWEKPVLTVLVRSRPEEQVLTACKFAGTAGPNRPAAQACAHPARGPCSAIAVT